ncbi:MAG: hypothetical protein R6U96_05400 [Promethearchaeia archaeon]
MKLDFPRMIIYGTISAIIYIVVPIILFNYLSGLGLISFKAEFKNNLLTLGVIFVIITLGKNMFSKETITSSAIGIISAIYSGFYAFYLFGGFSSEKTWGSYQIITENFVAVLGLQIIAWTLLASAMVRALGSGVRLIENIRAKGKERKASKKFHIHQIFSVIGLGISLFMLGYLGSIAYSGSNISVNVKEEYDYDYDNAGTPTNYTDDKFNITMYFDLQNYGFYAISDVVINVDIYTIETTDPSQLLLPDDTKIGEVDDVSYGDFPSKQTAYEKELVVQIFSDYAAGLAQYDANLSLRVHFSSNYAEINIDFFSNQTTQWESMI